ncbi:hypothetical protein PI124_g13032 [Phytophthora idaei]|nr:hypothetical protein PI125_g13750 [Phytophthora idaei]KAG3242130.1 hypothetical protein PI124_g13032 [Phytophthora idaei]
MLSFGTRKKYSEEWTEYDLLEDLLESILEDEHGETVPLDATEKYGQLRTGQQERDEQEEEAFALLAAILEDDDKPCDQDTIVHVENQPPGIDPLEMKNLEDAAFALLEAMLEDDDEPIDEDILFPPRKFRQLQHNESLMEAYVLVDSIVQVGRDLNRIEFTFHNIRD